jgi:hypothetical protein
VRVFNGITRFLLSLRTAVWLLVLLLILFFAGAFVMPAEKSFQLLGSVPLFEWLAAQPVSATWWLWGCIGILGVLALSTLFCSVESVIRKRKTERWILVISPQIVHIGFLFMLLAHLLSSLGGFKSFGIAGEGGVLTLPDGGMLQITGINVSVDPKGYIVGWSVDVAYKSDSAEVRDVLMPNKPFFEGGVGIYARDVRAYPYREILIEVSKEPGAPWALLGGIFSAVGIIALVAFKMKRDYPVLPR